MELEVDPRTSRSERWRGALGGLVGALVFFGAAYWLYAWLNPILEARRDWLREMQGFLFTIVPLATAAGAGLGWWLLRPRRR